MSLVNATVDGPLAILDLENPPANSYSYEMFRELDEAILAARMNEAVQVIAVHLGRRARRARGLRGETTTHVPRKMM